MYKTLKFLTDIRLWYALVGILISIIAHELFHMAAHMGHIESVELFPNLYTIVEITIDSSGILTHDVEEAIAYTITALILFITIIDVFAISDGFDRRTLNETLFPTRKARKLRTSSQQKPTSK